MPIHALTAAASSQSPNVALNGTPVATDGKAAATWQDLPEDILHAIARRLEPHDLSRLAQVNRAAHAATLPHWPTHWQKLRRKILQETQRRSKYAGLPEQLTPSKAREACLGWLQEQGYVATRTRSFELEKCSTYTTQAQSVTREGEKFIFVANNHAGLCYTLQSCTLQGELLQKNFVSETEQFLYVDATRHLCITRDSQHTASLWNMSSGERLLHLKGHQAGLTCAALGETLLATGSNDATVRLWHMQTGALMRVMAHRGNVEHIAMQGQRLVTAASDGSIHFWDFKTGAERHWYNGTCWLLSMALTDDTLLVSLKGGTVRLWDLPSGEKRAFRGSTDSVSGIAMAAAGSLAVTVTNYGAFKLWNKYSGEPVTCTLPQQRKKYGDLSCVAVLGNRIVTGFSDGSVDIWQVQPSRVDWLK